MKKEEIKDSIHIVFGGEHHNPLGIIRSLGENGIKCVAIIVKGKVQISSKSKYISELYLVDSIEKGYKLMIEKYGNNKNKSFVYTSDDIITGFFDEHYDELKDKFYFYNAGKSGKLNFYMDKINICKLAEKCGLNVAKMWSVKRGEIPKDIEYPIITKACNSKMENWKSEVHICKDKKELIDAFKKIKSEEVILQKYIVKKNEIAVSGISTNKGKDVLYTMEINFNYLLEDTYSYYMTVRNFEGYNMVDKMNKMFSEIGFEGIFEIEFLLGEDNKKYFLEINFRPTAWNYASTVAGMPMPIIWSDAMLNKTSLKNSYKEYEKFNAILEYNDLVTRVKKQKMNIFKWFKDFRKSKCKYYYNIRDMKPFISFVNSYLKEKLKKD